MFAPQEFEWDEAKEANNRTKQGISFAAATRVFEDPRRIDYDASRAGDGEARRKVVGLIGNRLYTVVYTIRGTACRVISARRANSSERRLHDDRALQA